MIQPLGQCHLLQFIIWDLSKLYDLLELQTSIRLLVGVKYEEKGVVMDTAES